jgi:heterodisulfide reductase subunit B
MYMYKIHYSIEFILFSAKYILYKKSNFILMYRYNFFGKNVEQLSDKINSVTCATCWNLYNRSRINLCIDCIYRAVHNEKAKQSHYMHGQALRFLEI